MVDIHSHIIYGVDDGPSSIHESLRMVANAEKAGIRTIIATPHIYGLLFDRERLSDNFQEMVYRSREYDVFIRLGYEVLICPQSDEDSDDLYFTMDGTGNMLFELPFNILPQNGFETIYNIRLKNCIPILAHPERNRNFLKSLNELSGYINAGCLIQIDAASIIGVYGRNVRSFAKRLIFENKVDFVASNAHCANDYSQWYEEAYKMVSKWTGEENAIRLFSCNAKHILRWEERIHAVL